MNHTITLPLAAALLTLTSCATLKPHLKPLAEKLGERLKDAIVDIDPEGLAKDKLCDLYKEKGVALAEEAWAHEWPKFAPLFASKPDPAADMAYCQKLITDAGAKIVIKQSGSTSATAICFQAQFPANFKDRELADMAAVTCHEAAHIIEQQRVGCKDWARKYLTTISARMTYEGTAYALHWAILERHGLTPEKAASYFKSKADRFPESYLIPREVISDECTFEHWSGIRGALRERAGV